MKYLAFLVLFLGLPLLALAQGNTSTEFVPLTNIPFLTETGNAFSLETFLNGLYRISIGIAAVVAVLQIMRAGIMYMGGDSVTEKKEAKNLIALSIGGLILVLSPVIVFSIINPEILSLKIGNIDALAPTTLSEEARNNTLSTEPGISAAARDRCTGQGGTPVYTCTPKTGGIGRVVSITDTCSSTENATTVCRRTETTPDPGLCTAYGAVTASNGQTCNAEQGLRQINASCCSGLSNGAVCCGKQKTTNEMYSWKGEFQEGACSIRSATCPTQALKGGPHQDKAACLRDMETTVPDGYVLKGLAQCTCNNTIGEQPTGACPPN